MIVIYPPKAPDNTQYIYSVPAGTFGTGGVKLYIHLLTIGW